MVRHRTRAGTLLRVADPDWADPLDPRYAELRGGRWNPPGSFGVLYLCASVEVARAVVDQHFAGLPYGPEDLDPDTAPLLVEVELPAAAYVDAVSAAALASLHLPASYPDDGTGRLVAHRDCQGIGARLHAAGEAGVSCRSAARLPSPGEELAVFDRPNRARPRLRGRRGFESWYW